MTRREIICRRLILRQRRRYAEEGRIWPGKLEAAGTVTKYPNLLAELDASGKTLDKLAGYARVSPEVMADALEDGGTLDAHELRRLAHNVGRLPPGYLADRVLHLVDPETNKGKKLLRRLADTLVPPRACRWRTCSRSGTYGKCWNRESQSRMLLTAGRSAGCVTRWSMGKRYRPEIAKSERKGLVDMFRYKPSIRASYEQQGYIYFVSKLYKQLPDQEREKIRLLCRETGGPYSRALLEHVTTGIGAEAVCLKHAISRSTLDRAVRRYYESFSQRIS